MNSEQTFDAYQSRMSRLELLDDLGERFEGYKKKEQNWRRARAATWLAPLLTACTLVSPGIKEAATIDKMALIEIGSVYVGLFGFLLSDHMRRHTFIKSRTLAQQAVPIVEELAVATPTWVNRGLKPDSDTNPVETQKV